MRRADGGRPNKQEVTTSDSKVPSLSTPKEEQELRCSAGAESMHPFTLGDKQKPNRLEHSPKHVQNVDSNT